VRETDVLDALQTSAWPDCCGEDLRAHVRGCQSCGELVEIVLPLLDEHRAATTEARVPSSAIVWWRLQMRARQEASRTAMRPITVIQGLALACASGLLIAAVGFVSPEFRHFAAWLVGLGAAASVELPAIPWSDLRLFSPLGVAAALAVTLFIVVTPVALYFVVSDE
jgi:hypothetical protein